MILFQDVILLKNGIKFLSHTVVQTATKLTTVKVEINHLIHNKQLSRRRITVINAPLSRALVPYFKKIVTHWLQKWRRIRT